MTKVHCQGCGRQIGMSNATRTSGIFCTTPYCALLPAASGRGDGDSTDARDGIIRLLLAQGRSTRDLAAEFGLSHQRVGQLGRAA